MTRSLNHLTYPICFVAFHLVRFDVSNNELTGEIPVEYGNWSQLEQFRIERNALIGSVPESVCDALFCVEDYLHMEAQADCSSPPGEDQQEIVCPCCTYCCEDGGICAPSSSIPPPDLVCKNSDSKQP